MCMEEMPLYQVVEAVQRKKEGDDENFLVWLAQALEEILGIIPSP